MQRQFIFTEDSSFTSVKDKMHMSVTEHFMKEDETQKLYHYVVSYGSWFHISDASIFMSHLLEKIGVTGYCKAYSAQGCEIDLPWYPARGLESKSIVELPEGFDVEQCEFGKSKGEMCDDFKKTFLAKNFKLKTSTQEQEEYSGEYIIKELFGSTAFECGVLKVEDKDYPLYCALTDFKWHTKKDMMKILKGTDICKNVEVRSILKKFVKIDISKFAREFEKETEKDISSLTKELKERQAILRAYLLFKRPNEKSEELEV